MNMKKSPYRSIRAMILAAVAFISISGMLFGCSNTSSNTENPAPTNQTNNAAQGNTTSSNEPPSTSTTETNTGQQPANDTTEGYLPEGVQVKRVLVDKQMQNGAYKKVELLTDGGKRTTITNADGKVTMQDIEYDGVILSVNGSELTVQVENGDKKTITIPEDVYIEDEDGVGFNKNVEIEWTVDQQGRIDSVDLDN